MTHPPGQPEKRVVAWSLAQYASAARAVPRVVGGELVVDGLPLHPEATLVAAGQVPVRVRDLIVWATRYGDLAEGDNPAQLAALMFDATGDPWALAHFFPAAAILGDVERAALFGQIVATAHHPRLDLRLIGERQRDLSGQLPASARWLVAGHLVEVLGERPDILAALLGTPRHIRLYTSARAFTDDGGVAGGDYDPTHERIQLGLGRLFEGFGGARPGVAPLLHELGHMLDAFEAATGRMTGGRGLLPGLDPHDGALFTPEARRAFVDGKALEARRYGALVAATSARRQRVAEADLPLGHPYVFQNDGEFIAGYLELFFRTPNRFAALNPALFDGFARLLRQDPRPAWPEDFAYYVEANRAAYRGGDRLATAGITVPGVRDGR